MLNLQSLIIVASLAGVLLISGCATLNYGEPYDMSNISLKTERSRFAKVDRVNIYKQQEGTLIRGEVRRNFYGRGTIPGHVDIELTDSTGKSVFKEKTYSRHTSLRSHYADFSIKIPFPVAKGSHLRIVHHDGGHREDCVKNDQKG